ncbi:hypothetical protein KCP70_04990 [Salmonella enterica subsp. enterica]|nr:hypothetical protein KCP70_04990 [Salmonella enterica subsp. enterica]
MKVRLSGWTWKMSFHYDSGNRILRRISFSIHAGETVAVVAPLRLRKINADDICWRALQSCTPAVWLQHLRANRIFAT